MGIRDEFNTKTECGAVASRADDMGKPPPKLPDELAASYDLSDRKLGTGSFGTVWLATEIRDSSEA